MRVSKLGSRFLRVVSADGKVRYYSSSGISSFRLFWIFRNFSSLDDRVLSARQLHLIECICRTAESQTKTVDPAEVLGTLELSRSDNWRAPSPTPSEAVRATALAAEHQPSRVRQPFAVSAILLAVSLSTVAAGVMNKGVRLRVSGAVLELRSFGKSLLPRVPQERTDTRELSRSQQSMKEPALQPTVLKVSSVDQRPTAALQLPRMDGTNSVYPETAASETLVSIQKAALVAVSGTSSVLPLPNALATGSSVATAKPSPVVLRRQPSPATASTRIISSPSSQASASTIKGPSLRRQRLTESLPSSGPPLVHPVPDLSPVSRDMQVILRALVSADGKVAEVSVIEGNSKLGREAARAVSSWRYSPRPTIENAESRIVFRVSPDVVTVSFPEGGTEIARR